MGEPSSKGEGEAAPAPERAELLAALEAEERRRRQLAGELAEAEARVAALHRDLSNVPRGAVTAEDAKAAAPRSPAEKLKVFRQLFRGREDVYPIRFVSKKTAKPGYAPDSANKFVAGVCQLPKVKCGDCTKQAFRRVDDAAVLGHLRGKHVMGVYPMLPDETCWLLAADFDKSTWREDVSAFVTTARRFALTPLIERSRSGNGAHVWFFFSEPVGAAVARKIGCHLITETMAERHELSMDSYDRLFPSQDTMLRGGFGNLIALPLQHGPRKEGNSVFSTMTSRPSGREPVGHPRRAPSDRRHARRADRRRGDSFGADRGRPRRRAHGRGRRGGAVDAPAVGRSASIASRGRCRPGCPRCSRNIQTVCRSGSRRAPPQPRANGRVSFGGDRRSARQRPRCSRP